jgi:hypothetical protein
VVGSFAIVIAGMYLFYVKFPQYFIAWKIKFINFLYIFLQSIF